jgi:hypothetical protein
MTDMAVLPASHQRLRRLGALAVVNFLVLMPSIDAQPKAVYAAPSSSLPGSVSCDATPIVSSNSSVAARRFTPLTPRRVIDTRSGTGGPAEPLRQGCVLRLAIDGLADIPTSAVALELSVTAVDSVNFGFLTAYACDDGRPPTSNLNTRLGAPAPNQVMVAVGTSRAICIFTSVTTHVVVDVFGWFGTQGLRHVDLEPVRVLDTRTQPQGELGRLHSNSVLHLPLAGSTLPSSAAAVAANFTVASSHAPGFLVAFPCGGDVPLASNVNFLAGEERAGSALVGLGAGGALCVLSNVDVDLIIDVTGYFEAPGFGPDTTLRIGAAHRLVDTRDGTGGSSTPLPGGHVLHFAPDIDAAGPASAYAAALNIVATGSSGAGHLRLYPCDDPPPLVSAVNFRAVEEATNMLIVPIGRDGLICVFASSATDVVIDQVALMSAPGMISHLDIAGADPFPTFDPTERDYSIVCAAGGANLTVRALGVPGVDVTVGGLLTTSTQSLFVETDKFVGVVLSRGSERAEYRFRCLPPDFPTYSIERPGEPQAGWYVGTLGWGTALGQFVVILDERGALVWYKRTEATMIDVKPWMDGNLAWVLLGSGSTPDRGYRVTRLDGSLVEELTNSGIPTDHHDLAAAPGGNHALISYVPREHVDLTALGAEYSTDETVVDGVIQELDSSGALVWEWKSVDHIAPEETTWRDGQTDLLHINSIDPQPNGDYIVSARHLDSVLRIDRSTGKVLWKLGGSEANLDGAVSMTILNDPLHGPRAMHDARLTPDGVLTMHDNRSNTGEPARVVAYQLDEVNHTATLIWEHREPQLLQSGFIGSARRQPDGGFVICWGGLQPFMDEVDVNGNRLMAFSSDVGGFSYRFIKAAPSTFDREMLEQTAGGIAAAP